MIGRLVLRCGRVLLLLITVENVHKTLKVFVLRVAHLTLGLCQFLGSGRRVCGRKDEALRIFFGLQLIFLDLARCFISLHLFHVADHRLPIGAITLGNGPRRDHALQRLLELDRIGTRREQITQLSRRLVRGRRLVKCRIVSVQRVDEIGKRRIGLLADLSLVLLKRRLASLCRRLFHDQRLCLLSLIITRHLGFDFLDAFNNLLEVFRILRTNAAAVNVRLQISLQLRGRRSQCDQIVHRCRRLVKGRLSLLLVLRAKLVVDLALKIRTAILRQRAVRDGRIHPRLSLLSRHNTFDQIQNAHFRLVVSRLPIHVGDAVQLVSAIVGLRQKRLILRFAHVRLHLLGQSERLLSRLGTLDARSTRHIVLLLLGSLLFHRLPEQRHVVRIALIVQLCHAIVVFLIDRHHVLLVAGVQGCLPLAVGAVQLVHRRLMLTDDRRSVAHVLGHRVGTRRLCHTHVAHALRRHLLRQVFLHSLVKHARVLQFTLHLLTVLARKCLVAVLSSRRLLIVDVRQLLPLLRLLLGCRPFVCLVLLNHGTLHPVHVAHALRLGRKIVAIPVRARVGPVPFAVAFAVTICVLQPRLRRGPRHCHCSVPPVSYFPRLSLYPLPRGVSSLRSAQVCSANLLRPRGTA